LSKEKYEQKDYDIIFRLFIKDDIGQSKMYFNEKSGTEKLIELVQTENKPWDLIELYIKDTFIY